MDVGNSVILKPSDATTRCRTEIEKSYCKFSGISKMDSQIKGRGSYRNITRKNILWQHEQKI
ncbi:MAG TPA: hypothetical protein VI278_06425 [Nitrososphaeraceae archaeon]